MRQSSEQSENMEDDDMTAQSLKIKRSIEHTVPCFPKKKMPSYAVVGAFKITDQQSHGEPQILSLLSQFRNASGNSRRELECQLIRRLVNQKSHIEWDQYMVSAAWSVKYTNYLYDNSNTLPGPIDNTPLIGRTDLIANTDYFSVNQIVWQFILDEYKGGPEMMVENKQHKPPLSVSSLTTSRTKSVDVSIVSSTQEDRSIEIKPVGLRNELYYCYMHASLQNLFSITELNDFMINGLRKIKAAVPRSLYDQLKACRYYAELLDQINSTQNEYTRINSLRLFTAKRFNPKLQHDAAEFLLFLLSTFEDELLNLNKELSKLKLPKCLNITTIFKGSIESNILCKNCSHSLNIQEEFLSLSLAIQKSTSINQCLDDFLKEEKILDYKCEKCNKRKSAVKKTRITRLPQYLLIHLKRFKYFPKTNKISSFIVYPDQAIFLETQYKLLGTVIHQGSLEQGHYYSFSKRKHKWYLFNDQTVKIVHKKDILQQQVYILLYQQL